MSASAYRRWALASALPSPISIERGAVDEEAVDEVAARKALREV
jgi:hypothetical protein